MSARLEHCPECGGPWPAGPDYNLRGMGWLQGLSRAVSPTNGDVDIHDFHRDGRFLRFEIKRPSEKPWPPSKGQLWLLQALASSPKWTVRLMRGTTRNVDIYTVTADGVDFSKPIHTHAEAIRRAVDLWLRGALWRDAEELLTATPAEHVCGWARVAGVWTCVGDYYSAGHQEQEETACGATLPEYA